MDHQGVPNVNFNHYTLKKSELAKNWPSSGPRLSRISTFNQCTQCNVYFNNDNSHTELILTLYFQAGGVLLYACLEIKLVSQDWKTADRALKYHKKINIFS